MAADFVFCDSGGLLLEISNTPSSLAFQNQQGIA
jgi:hypothetical protein